MNSLNNANAKYNKLIKSINMSKISTISNLIKFINIYLEMSDTMNNGTNNPKKIVCLETINGIIDELKTVQELKLSKQNLNDIYPLVIYSRNKIPKGPLKYLNSILTSNANNTNITNNANNANNEYNGLVNQIRLYNTPPSIDLLEKLINIYLKMKNSTKKDECYEKIINFLLVLNNKKIPQNLKNLINKISKNPIKSNITNQKNNLPKKTSNAHLLNNFKHI
jgi:hypothetical protein